ncbi:hypothetical protein LSAT2_007784 [Lamellibrachia satsuma]|nr:hypothetical protein LSAT2_007784 [Lamellibrachia satsuma]
MKFLAASKFTSETARKYGLKGWVKNTERGTVVGTVQGPDDKVKVMKEWLQYKGSPHSKIEKKEWLAKVGSKKSQIAKCDFHNESPIKSYSFTGFEIIREEEKKLKTKKLKPRLSRP